MERDDPEALKRVAQAAIARAAAAMLPKKAVDPEPLEPLGLEVPGAVPDRDLDGEGAAVCCEAIALCTDLGDNVRGAYADRMAWVGSTSALNLPSVCNSNHYAV